MACASQVVGWLWQLLQLLRNAMHMHMYMHTAMRAALVAAPEAGSHSELRSLLAEESMRHRKLVRPGRQRRLMVWAA